MAQEFERKSASDISTLTKKCICYSMKILVFLSNNIFRKDQRLHNISRWHCNFHVIALTGHTTQGWDLGFKAKRLGFGPQSGIWTSRLRFGPQDWVLGKIRQKLAEFGRNWLKLTDFGRIWQNLAEFGRIW